MKVLSMNEIAVAVGGEIFCGRPEQTVNRVSRDSRSVDCSTLFFPLKGENHDGHEFIRDVVDVGCRCLVVSSTESLKTVRDEEITVILVEDTLAALQRLAAWYIRQLDIKIIGITGSVGKTTTKDMLTAICRQKYVTGSTSGNYNNHIGMPLTILDFDENTEVGILEMGMDKFGEIEFLADMSRPDIAIITAIGSAHIEFFGTRENIFKAKMEITKFMSRTDTLVINEGEDFLRPENVHGDYRVVMSGSGNTCDYLVSDIKDHGEEGMSFQVTHMWATQKFTIPVPGRHNVYNAAVAIAAAAELGIGMDKAAIGLASVETMNNRLSFKKGAGITVIDDTYNASPEAMKAAIDQLAAAEGSRKVAILGDMYELGESGPELLRGVGNHAVEKGIDLVIGVGSLGKLIAESAGGIGIETKEALEKELGAYIKEGDTVLVKASRGMALETTVDKLLDMKGDR